MPKLDWPPEKERKVRYKFKDEKELDENGVVIPLNDNRVLDKEKDASR